MYAALMQLIGVCVIAAGLYLMWPPAGVVALGVGIVAAGLVLERRDD